jgi:hypothetical protein
MRLRKIARESSEEIVVKCDCRNLGTFLALAGVGWLMYGAWIFRDTLFPKAGGGATLSSPSLAVWALSAIALTACLLWVAFGRRVATFAEGELRVHSTVGPLRVRGARVYPLTDIWNIRLWFQGVNDPAWETTNRLIVFDYRDRMVILFSRLPEHAADTLLRDTRRHALAAAPS